FKVIVNFNGEELLDAEPLISTRDGEKNKVDFITVRDQSFLDTITSDFVDFHAPMYILYAHIAYHEPRTCASNNKIML
ncbi:hypothetical protein SO802_003472, partial [Lithocarpus litseifolius]